VSGGGKPDPGVPPHEGDKPERRSRAPKPIVEVKESGKRLDLDEIARLLADFLLDSGGGGDADRQVQATPTPGYGLVAGYPKGNLKT
jgi:hypothetical protein